MKKCDRCGVAISTFRIEADYYWCSPRCAESDPMDLAAEEERLAKQARRAIEEDAKKEKTERTKARLLEIEEEMRQFPNYQTWLEHKKADKRIQLLADCYFYFRWAVLCSIVSTFFYFMPIVYAWLLGELAESVLRFLISPFYYFFLFFSLLGGVAFFFSFLVYILSWFSSVTCDSETEIPAAKTVFGVDIDSSGNLE